MKMKDKKKCYFVSNYVDNKDYENIYTKEKKPGIQIQKFDRLIVEGLIENDVDVICYTLIPASSVVLDNTFLKVKNQNKLTDENIEKIVKTYRERKDVPKYAHLASIEEIRQNDYNLNIPRYVDTSEEEEEIDIEEIKKLLAQDKKEIEELEAQIAEQFKLLGI